MRKWRIRYHVKLNNLRIKPIIYPFRVPPCYQFNVKLELREFSKLPCKLQQDKSIVYNYVT